MIGNFNLIKHEGSFDDDPVLINILSLVKVFLLQGDMWIAGSARIEFGNLDSIPLQVDPTTMRKRWKATIR